MKKIIILLVALLAATVVPAFAAARIVTLSVPGMICPACPVTVRTSLNRLPGVRVIAVNLQEKTVTVEVGDARVNDPALTTATRNAGYPSTVLKDSRNEPHGR